MCKDGFEFVPYSSPTAAVLQEIEALVESVEGGTGIVSAISFDHVLNCDKEMDCYFLAYAGSLLVGAATVFAPKADEGEIALCVRADHRRCGIGSALLAHAIEVLDRHRVASRILICDAKSVSGASFVRTHATTELFSEYTMGLSGGLPAFVEGDVAIRVATDADVPRMAEICAAAYGDPLAESRQFIETSMIAVQREGYVGSVGTDLVAVCFISTSAGARSVNTVAVDPRFQGRGYGREFLTKILHAQPRDGLKVVLDVNSTNANAFRLYERLGFEIESDIRYYKV